MSISTEAKERQSLVAIFKQTLANTPFKLFSPVLSFIQDKQNIFVCIQRIEVIQAGRIAKK